MNTNTVRVISASLLAAAAVLLAACGSSDSASTVASATTSTLGKPIGGMTTCDQATIEKAAADFSEANKYAKSTLVPEDGQLFHCADGWATAAVDTGTTTMTVIWQAEGQFWIPKDAAKVCPEPSPVPKAIYDLACKTN